jgi:electron transfer flavoprotein alpha subunit
MAGCAGSKCIVTINTDPDASIFKQSRFGIEADYNDVLPAFTEEVRKLLSG